MTTEEIESVRQLFRESIIESKKEKKIKLKKDKEYKELVRSKEYITDKVFNFISDRSKISRSKLTLNTNYIENLGFNDLDLFELTMDLENEFNIIIFNGEDDEDRDNLHTIEDLINLIVNYPY